jgi:ribonuclease T2
MQSEIAPPGLPRPARRASLPRSGPEVPMRWLAALALILAPPALAEGARAGDFDYWVLALSWSPNWCAEADRAETADQCDPDADFGWILHGLWPQYETGWPSYCTDAPAPPSRADTAAMADIMGSAGLAWHSWKKHGSCAGLSAQAYFARARAAYAAIVRPAAFRELTAPARLPAGTVEAAFLAANPGLAPEGVTVTCRDGAIAELRICLTREGLAPRPCGADVARDCTLPGATMAPIP